MPLSFGIPFGLLVIVIGAVLFLVTKHKRIAKFVVVIGVLITTLTLILLVLAFNSQM